MRFVNKDESRLLLRSRFFIAVLYGGEPFPLALPRSRQETAGEPDHQGVNILDVRVEPKQARRRSSEGPFRPLWLQMQVCGH